MFMKIRTKLLLISSIAIALSFFIAFNTSITTKQVNLLASQGHMADKTVREIFWLNIILNDYLANQKEQALSQWYIKYQSLKKLLDSQSYSKLPR